MSIVRVKFIKGDSVRYISHLDMMKAFQRSVRRAGLEAKYSHGFNPQMQMVFGAPLSLGFTSMAEYADFSFAVDYAPARVASALNEALPDGLRILDAGIRNIKANIMADIKFAEYKFIIKGGFSAGDLANAVNESESLVVPKTRKGKTKAIDIRPLIHRISSKGDEINMLVSAGNVDNLNPRLLADAIGLRIDPDAKASDYARVEQYVIRGGKKVLPLDERALNEKGS